MKTYLLVSPLLLLMLILPAPWPQQGIPADVLKYTNLEREKRSLRPLIADEGLNALAQKHSENMASGKVSFSHKGFDDRSRKARELIPTATSFAENVSFGPAGGREVVDGWMKSSGHRTNILGPSTRIGIGVAKDRRGVLYYTQFFAGEE